MYDCNEYCVQLTLYLDGELEDDGKEIVERHLKECRACREKYNRDRWLRECLQKASRFYTVPEELRAKVGSVLHGTPGRPTTRFRSTPSPIQPGLIGVLFGYRRSGYAALLVSMILIAGVWGAMEVINPNQSLTFAATAVDAHQRYTLGRLPLELESDSPDRISSWFDGKVPFSLKLPNYQEVSGQDKLYSLTGARLVGFKNDYAAYVAYQMGQHPISLVVTSSANAMPEGGESVASKGLIIHYDTIAGLKVITWTHWGLTYALVSDLDERGQKSCLVCHQGSKDKDFLVNLDKRGVSGDR